MREYTGMGLRVTNLGVVEFLENIWSNLRTELLDGIPSAIVMVIGGVIFLIVALMIIMVIRAILRKAFRKMPISKKISSLIVTVIYVLMLFVIMVAFLEMIGLGQIALALGVPMGSMPWPMGW